MTTDFIAYRTATAVSKVDNKLAGCFSYFADPQDALNTGLFCERVIIQREMGDHFDLLGKPFKWIPPDAKRSLRGIIKLTKEI